MPHQDTEARLVVFAFMMWILLQSTAAGCAQGADLLQLLHMLAKGLQLVNAKQRPSVESIAQDEYPFRSLPRFQHATLRVQEAFRLHQWHMSATQSCTQCWKI